MKQLLIRTSVLCFCVFAFSLSVSGQKQDSAKAVDRDSVGTAVAKGTGKVAVIIVGSAAKSVWVTTKFTAKHVAKPILLKAAPKAGLFLLKKSAVTAKYILPTVLKFSLL